eukprot:scaffold5366_cov350-Prasinococcus_capsulatus_cf.AAC.3
MRFALAAAALARCAPRRRPRAAPLRAAAAVAVLPACRCCPRPGRSAQAATRRPGGAGHRADARAARRRPPSSSPPPPRGSNGSSRRTRRRKKEEEEATIATAAGARLEQQHPQEDRAIDRSIDGARSCRLSGGHSSSSRRALARPPRRYAPAPRTSRASLPGRAPV